MVAVSQNIFAVSKVKPWKKPWSWRRYRGFPHIFAV